MNLFLFGQTSVKSDQKSATSKGISLAEEIRFDIGTRISKGGKYLLKRAGGAVCGGGGDHLNGVSKEKEEEGQSGEKIREKEGVNINPDSPANHNPLVETNKH